MKSQKNVEREGRGHRSWRPGGFVGVGYDEHPVTRPRRIEVDLRDPREVVQTNHVHRSRGGDVCTVASIGRTIKANGAWQFNMMK